MISPHLFHELAQKNLKYSNLKVTISAANKMVAKNSATPVNYNVIAGSSSVSVAYSSTADVTGTINNVNSNDVTVYAVDSRGNQTPKSKSFSVVDYTECSIKTLRIDRVDGVGENIQLTMTGIYSTTNFGTTTNNIKTAQLRMKAKTASSYGDWVSILNRLSISGGKITADNITISDVTFALGTEYDVQIRITDELSEDIETASISDGTVLWSAVKGKGVNFGGLYDLDEGGELQVNGKKVQPKIKSENIVYFTPTNANVSNYEGYGNCYYYRVGSRVHLHIGVKIDTTKMELIYILPTGYKPITALGYVGIGASMSSYATIQITTNGGLNIYSSSGYALIDCEYDTLN